jgi:hypothetical protein
MSEERLSLTLDARRTAIVVIDLQKGIVRMPGAPSPRPTVVANARADDFCSEDGSPRPAAGRAPDGTSERESSPLSPSPPVRAEHESSSVPAGPRGARRERTRESWTERR